MHPEPNPEPPLQLIVGPPEHAVTACANVLAACTGGAVHRVSTLQATDVLPSIRQPTSVHVHFTDKLFGSTPEEAADQAERLARSASLTVTVHDVPQPSDGQMFARRVAAYRRVVAAARGVVCNSEYERALLAEHGVTVPTHSARVIPLPIDPYPFEERGAFGPSDAFDEFDAFDSFDSFESRNAEFGVEEHPRDEVAILGYFYPGKGHAEVISAMSSARVPLSVTAIGAASSGHEADLQHAITAASAAGVTFTATGYLSEDSLISRCRRAVVPLAAHRHFSASASVNTWIAAGRRPLAPDAAYTREMARLRPGTLTLYDPEKMSEAIENAVRDPRSTWLQPGVSTVPTSADSARAYLAWWRELS